MCRKEGAQLYAILKCSKNVEVKFTLRMVGDIVIQ
jgi:hypothetical protein